jgi:molybdopterin-containing oxidoreductase family iron-sulfur binding subunit
LIDPLYGGRTVAEILAAFAGETTPVAHDLARARFAASGPRDEAAWERALADGVVENTASTPVAVTVDWAAGAKELARVLDEASTPTPRDVLEAVFVRDPKVHDGAFTNVAWLLELPDPITKLTWENAALLSPATASRLGISSHDAIELSLDGRTVRAPALVVPGQADDTVIVPLGWGRVGAESLARGLGFDGRAIQPASSPRVAVGLTLTRVGSHPLATTQEHASLEGRDLVKHATLGAYRANPRFAKQGEEEPRPHLYRLPLAPGAQSLGPGDDQWAMSIDLNACTGCSACVIACQAENNVPVVGKPAVQMSREMHWLRIDRYFEGPPEDPRVLVEPMLCQHCESAPCEYVCPVNATVHSADGINEQVYNRCIGTRFCSNNCAWKVRRFNWFDFHERAVEGRSEADRELYAMSMNPDVTVRARGVMEKCTFCIQRVREAGIHARSAPGGPRPIDPRDVTTACAQACPTEAIVFGSLAWKEHEVVRRRENERAFEVLGELGTEPRVRYLARLRNPNPELEDE